MSFNSETVITESEGCLVVLWYEKEEANKVPPLFVSHASRFLWARTTDFFFLVF